MKTALLFPIVILAGLTAAPAQSTSTGPTGTLLHAPAGTTGGGGHVTGPTVTADISTGDAASGLVTTVSTAGVVVKGNFIGQLYQAGSLDIAATPAVVPEGGTSQLSGALNMDDATVLPVPAGQITWSAGPGPAASLSSGGLVTTAPVLRATSFRLDGSYQGLPDPDGTLLQVTDTGETDAFQQYAGDQIDDGWQVDFFGLPPNALAAPTADPDGDGRTNRTEFLSGFSPTDPAAFLEFIAQGFSSGNVLDFRLNKVLPGRTYTIKANSDLQTTPQPVGPPITVPTGQTNYLFQDPAAGQRKFYYLEITRP